MAMRGGCFIVPHSGQFDELDRWLTLKKDINFRNLFTDLLRPLLIGKWSVCAG